MHTTIRTANMFLIILLLVLYRSSIAFAQTNPAPPKQEVRAVWITTVNGLDWPKSTDPAEQQRSLREMVMKLHSAHFNTIFFQVRGRGDALYRSSLEPWSDILTGTLGKDPGWDPLQFVIDEAHARAMEVHAWFNTFYVRSGKGEIPPSKPRHVALEHPDWVQTVDGQSWLDPGLPAVRNFLLRVGMEIVRNYDVDGVASCEPPLTGGMRSAGVKSGPSACRYAATGSRSEIFTTSIAANAVLKLALSSVRMPLAMSACPVLPGK